MVDATQMARLIAYARQCGLETLVEAHNMEEVENDNCLFLLTLWESTTAILPSFEVDDNDVGRTEALARFCKSSRPLISESSISSWTVTYGARARSGADAVLVGTAVLKAHHQFQGFYGN